jgi:hypothetical protein
LIHNPSAFFATWNVKASWQRACNQRPRNAGKIVSRLRGRKPCRRNKRDDGSSLPEAEFHDKDTVRRKKPPRVGSYCTVAVKAIAPAVERKAGIESAHLGFKRCNLLTRNIWRIRDEDIDRTLDRCSIIASKE